MNETKMRLRHNSELGWIRIEVRLRYEEDKNLIRKETWLCGQKLGTS